MQMADILNHSATQADGNMLADDPYERVLTYQGDMIGFFTGSKIDNDAYEAMRKELLEDPRFGGLAPKFFRRCRDTGSLWSFAKNVDSSWEPRRKFVRDEFEPLLSFLETGGSGPRTAMPGPYDTSAWTGVQGSVQQAKAIKTLVPVAQATVQVLIDHLEKPNHNGDPPLDEMNVAIKQLRSLHMALGQLLLAADEGRLTAEVHNGLLPEIARYGKRAARALKNDPLPYALTALLLAISTACGVPGIGGYLAGVAMSIKKKD